MPAYSFKERFVPLVKSGLKRQTIRKKRKGQAKPGSKLYFYFGMRTKWCTKIGEAICKSVSEIEIQANGTVKVAGKKMNKVQKYAIAKADGFEDFDTMLRWWKQTHELPFVGDIIYW
jgi:hypothetical protein